MGDGTNKNTSCNWGSGNFAITYFKTFLFLFFCVVVSKVEESPLSDKVLMFEKWLLYLSLGHLLLIIASNVFFRKWNSGFKRLKEYGDESLSWMQAQKIEVKVNLKEKRIPEEDLFSLHSEPRTILHRPMFSSGSSG